MSGLDSEQIKYAIKVARERGFQQVRIRSGTDRFTAVLPSEEAPTSVEDRSTVAQPAHAPESPQVVQAVESPAVGYFRSLEPAMEPGMSMGEGDKVGEVVALGLANDVTMACDGEITEVCVQDGDAVEYGQSILMVKQKQ